MKKEVGIFYINRSNLLYKSKVEYADFCINHVDGCSHGCRFPCYAFNMAKRFGKVKTYEEWCKPKLVKNSLQLLDKEIPKYKNQIKFVHLCFTTDPFMYKQPEISEMTLKIIEKLNQNNIKCTVLTKGIYPRDLTEIKKYGRNNEYGITIVSLNESFRKIFEPNSSNYLARIKALKKLHDFGLRTWVSMEPYPTPNLVKQDLLKILREISFVDNIIFGKLNYNVKSSSFIDNKDFYEEQARIVEKFCKIKRIKYHIKYGTKKTDNFSTSTILGKPLVSFQTIKEDKLIVA